ncbi:MAG: AraC family transcriptional regulator [Bacteroidota bacterium]
MAGLLDQHRRNRKLTTLVENRTTYQADFAELNIYETHTIAERVELEFDFPIIASMLTGKKIMHLDQLPSFAFLPGESVVMPANERMVIDFPVATQDAPTQCLALGIDRNKVKQVVHHFNQRANYDSDCTDWQLDNLATHLTHHQGVNHLLQRMITTFTTNGPSREVLLDLMTQELIVRLLQTKARTCLLEQPDQLSTDTRISMVLHHIRKHLTEKNINVEDLAKLVQMSSSTFHRKFRSTLGISPVEYINGEKIKFAKRLMQDHPNMFISEVAYKSGFNSVSYFNRQFKKVEAITPQAFKKSLSFPS